MRTIIREHVNIGAILDSLERRSRDTRPQPAQRNAAPSKAAPLAAKPRHPAAAAPATNH